MLLKQEICSHSRKKASTFRKRVSSFERTMYFLQRRSDQGDDVASLLVDTKAKLEKTLLQKAQECHICFKVQWEDDGKAPTKYFFNFGKKRGESRLFFSIS